MLRSVRDAEFDELDIAIVDAVRSAPRVSWRDLAPVMGVNAATIRRRWSRMQAAGVVWVTAHPAGEVDHRVRGRAPATEAQRATAMADENADGWVPVEAVLGRQFDDVESRRGWCRARYPGSGDGLSAGSRIMTGTLIRKAEPRVLGLGGTG
ncbi:AsnC family protein [Amycolatopsis coloradensis]